MKKAIVTGAHGYIGSVLCNMLEENGYEVMGIDNVLDYQAERTKHCKSFHYADFSSDGILNFIQEYQKDATIFHLAANSLLGPSATDPLSYFENNTVKTLKLIKHLSPTNKFIFASTAAVYGQNDSTPKTVNFSKIDPPNNYGLSKYMTEQMLDSYCKIGEIRATSFRFFNVIGAYKDSGQQKGTPHIINKLCEAAHTNTPFIVNGNNFDTKDGTCIRDYVHVVDICQAMIHADRIMDNRDPGHVAYNLGTERGLSVKEIIDIFRAICHDVDVVYGPRRPGDPPVLIANPNKFMNETLFKYEYDHDSVPIMIQHAWNYYNTCRCNKVYHLDVDMRRRNK